MMGTDLICERSALLTYAWKIARIVKVVQGKGRQTNNGKVSAKSKMNIQYIYGQESYLSMLECLTSRCYDLPLNQHNLSGIQRAAYNFFS